MQRQTRRAGQDYSLGTVGTWGLRRFGAYDKEFGNKSGRAWGREERKGRDL